MIVVTQAKEDAGGFAKRLKAHGSRVYLLPTISMVKKRLSAAGEKKLKNAGSYDYIIFGSAHAVKFFGKRDVGKAKIVAVGPATARAAKAVGLKVWMVPKEFTSKAVARELKNVAGKRILIPRSAIAPQDLPHALQKRGAKVHTVATYTTAAVSGADKTFNELLMSGRITAITFASASSVTGLSKRIRSAIMQRNIKNIPAISIGPRTSKAAKRFGFKKVIQAKPFTIEGMIQTINHALS